MMNLTVRNIPDDVINKIKVLSEIDKRSLNNEILIILEKGLYNETKNRENLKITKDTQIKIWNKLSGNWEDKRNTDEIIKDIYSTRSLGREVEL